MKKQIFTLLLALVGSLHTLSAQWVTSGNNVYNTNTGYVGIGTSSPTSFLNVAGNSSTNPEIQADHYFSNFGGATVQVRKARGTRTVPLVVANGDYLGSFESWGYAGSSFVRGSYVGTVVNGTPNATAIPTDLVFATNNGSWPDAIEWMRLDKNGNLGIGTTVPTEKLSVKGKIRAQEVKVELANWPDYVFTKAYKLPSLAETETHIKEKGHLPGIPSAAEVKENGVELGEMNKKLLQKIEELTLHLIEQKKRVDLLVRENEQQKEDIEKLKSK
ncbi:hypothetical protein [Pedobacter sp. JY14-1]|uniref:hypothetical protein n=1 Tax=Pedobacter sp. JY14-1 TaxID=3034151 RepID=UPI0023E0EC40|nr:hypothetical protein [Pedobacter sp. JY14-1]